MKHIAIFLTMTLLLLMASRAIAGPQVNPAYPKDSVVTELTWAAGDDTETAIIPVGGICSLSFIVGGSDVVAVYQVPTATTAVLSGTIVTTFSATTTEPFPFEPGQLGIKAIATTATTGGSKLIVRCSNTQLSHKIRSDGTLPGSQTLTECIPLMAGAVTLPVTNPAVLETIDGDNFPYKVATIDDSTDKALYLNFNLPENITGTLAKIRYQWLPVACAADSADDVCLTFDLGSYQNHEAFDAGALGGTAVAMQDTCTTALFGYVSPWVGITTGFDVTEGAKDTFATLKIENDEDLSSASCNGDNNELVGNYQITGIDFCYEVNNVASGGDSTGDSGESTWGAMIWDSGEWS